MCSEPGFGASVSGSRTTSGAGSRSRPRPRVLPQSSVGGRRVTCSCARVSPDFERRSSFVDAGWAEFWHRTGIVASSSHGSVSSECVCDYESVWSGRDEFWKTPI